MAFRQAALTQGVSVAAYLGRLVEREVHRRTDRKVARVSLEAPEPDQALAALAEVRASIDELDEIAGRLARSATAHGASWEDVGSSLRLNAQQARRGIRAASLGPRPERRLQFSTSVVNSGQLRPSTFAVSPKRPANPPLLSCRSQVRILPGA